jgi:transcriptional regulator with XRE-family HTH domain
VLRIRELREAHDPRFSQEDLAYRAGVSVKTVARAERRGTASSKTLWAFAQALDVTVDELFREPEAVA